MSTERQGFSLIEVLLAILLLGLSLTVFFGAANQGLSLVSEAREYETGRTLLHQLDLVEPLDLENLDEGVETGSFSTDLHPSVSWTREIRVEGKEEDRLFHILTRVEWGGDRSASSHSESVETLLHLPTAMKGGWVREPAE